MVLLFNSTPFVKILLRPPKNSLYQWKTPNTLYTWYNKAA